MKFIVTQNIMSLGKIECAVGDVSDGAKLSWRICVPSLEYGIYSKLFTKIPIANHTFQTEMQWGNAFSWKEIQKITLFSFWATLQHILQKQKIEEKIKKEKLFPN